MAPAEGDCVVTVGGVVSATTVVKDHETGALMALPATSFAPLTVAVYVVDGASGALGVSVAVWVASLYATVAVTGLFAASFRVKVKPDWIDSLKVAVTVVFAGTLVAFAAGDFVV